MAISVRPDALQALVERSLVAAGCEAEEAGIVAGHLVEANMKGHDSHGVGLFAGYAAELLAGR